MAWLAAPVVGMAVRVCVVAMAVETVAQIGVRGGSGGDGGGGLGGGGSGGGANGGAEAVGSAQGSFASLHQSCLWPPSSSPKQSSDQVHP